MCIVLQHASWGHCESGKAEASLDTCPTTVRNGFETLILRKKNYKVLLDVANNKKKRLPQIPIYHTGILRQAEATIAAHQTAGLTNR